MIKFRKRNELISPMDLEEFEQKLEGLKLPSDYKLHMSTYNGGSSEEEYCYKGNEDFLFASFNPIKHGSNTMENGLIARTNVLPKDDIYIGEILTGSICMSLGENYGAIYAFYSDGERIDLASSFTEFVNGLTPLDE